MNQELSAHPTLILPRFSSRILFALVLFASFSLAAHAQVNGRIKGTVVDPTGAIIPNAQVLATNQQSGVKYTTVSQKDGGYLFPELPVGTYSVTVTMPGFKTFSAAGIVLTIDQEYVEPVQLAPGSGAGETVSVEADSVQVNTTDMQLDNVVDAAQMEELPLIGRTFTGLELTLPGVQASSDRFGGNYSVSGAQTQQSEYLINGADSNDIALNTLAIAPNLDAIDQFNLIEGPLNAEYDRNSGGIVSATIKQGTNSFHGDAFEFYRDTFLNTRNYFATSVTPYHQNIFGGTLGGPVVKDKLFFFGAYQGVHQRVPEGSGTSGNSVYTSGNLAGDFSADNGTTVVRPVSPTATTAGGSYGSFLGNYIPSSITIPGCTSAGETWAQCAYDLKGVFPASAFNPIATKLTAKYLPTEPANVPYNVTETQVTTSNQEIGRLDYALNPSNHFTGVGIYFKQTLSETLPFTGASVPGFGDQDIETIQQYTADYVHQFSATAINDFAAHWTRFNYQAVIPQNVVAPSSLGFSINPQDAAAASVPTISVGGVNQGFTLGFSTNGPQPRIDQVYQLDETVSKTLGHHQLKFGYDGRRFNVSNPFSADNSGSYSFGNTGTYSSGDGGLDFLFGNPATYAQGSGASIQADAFLNYFFAQDNWKLTNTFTLDYGLGYSIDTPLRNHQYGGEGIACIVPGEQSKIFANSPVGFVYPGDPGCHDTGQATTKYTELGPRIGFAWSPDLGAITGGAGKFAIRGGFGIYYDRSEEESALQTLETPPFGTSTQGAGDFGGSPQFANPFSDINGGGSEGNKFPYTFPSKGQTINYANLEPLYNISSFGPSFRAPYAENFQLSVERELPSHIITRVSYVGSLSRHNQITYDANPITPAGHAACLADTKYCAGPNPIYREEQSYFFPSHTASGAVDPNTGEVGYLDIGEVGSEASSSYNALQVSVEKAPTHGLTFQVSYTYSHALDTASSFENAGFGESSTRGYNQFDPATNYGDSAYDARQRLVVSPIYITPRFEGSWFSLKNMALSGWEISGITTLATGFPFDISYAGGSANSLWCPDYLNFYACPDVPNQTGSLIRSNPRLRNAEHGYGQWFEPTTFSAEAIGTFGNVHRDPFHGPGLNNTNMILAKNFPLGGDGSRRLQIRMESDNVFNHTQFTNPSGSWNDQIPNNLSTTGFGVVTGSQSARQTQLAAKIYF